MKLSEDTDLIRTIHKAKGAEFESVFLCLKEESNLKCILEPDLDKEMHRIFYVALSRAKDRLYMSVPAISSKNEELLKGMGINVEYVLEIIE